MPKHLDYCTHISNPEDLDILGRKLFDVNLRLYKSAPEYRKIVNQCCDYIRWNAQTPKEGYKAPHGFSGANGGVPFNIIGLADGTVWVNPTYVNIGTDTRESWSNCGSLTLRSPIRIQRYSKVLITGYKWSADTAEDGLQINLQQQSLKGYYPTIQHEVDHNNGILITDRRAKGV
jgi:hypothetical protein